MATTRRAPKQPLSPVDPIDRAREIADAPRRLTGRAHKHEREILTGIIEEHVAFLERSVPLGDIERAMHSVRRLGVLVTELKALEGWTWEYPRLTNPDRAQREIATNIIEGFAAAGEALRLQPARPATLRAVADVDQPGDPDRIAALKQILQRNPDLARAVREILHERGTEGLEPVPVAGTVE
jgi:hypothetical protein